MAKSRYSPTEQIGVHAVGTAVTENLGWIFREQVVADMGIDAHIEACEDENPTGRLIGLQIKSGESFFKEMSDEKIVYRGSIDHLNYWSGHALPVVIVLYEPKSKTCYWEVIDENNVQRTDKGWKIEIPKNHVLTADAKAKLAVIAEGSIAHQNLRKLVLAKPLICAINQGATYFLEAEEWVNKTSGKGAIRVVEEKTVVVEWRSFLAGFTSYESLFRDMFPWAEFVPDYNLYEEAASNEYDVNHGVWDNEDKEYFIVDPEERRKYISEACSPGIRPFDIKAGEVAEYRLQLTINEIGKSFLVLDNYLSSHQTIVGNFPL